MYSVFAKIAAVGCAMVAMCFLALIDPRPIVFESLESRTLDGHPVFNRIQWQPFSQDTWRMQQSHQGPNVPLHLWDKLQIKMGSSSEGTIARFAELEPSAAIDEETKAIPLKVPCYRCHVNGPRAIRPNYHSREASLGYWQRFRIALMNLRIASYGTLLGVSESPGKVPFQYHQATAQKLMPLKSCAPCHNQEGGFSRSPLRYQHIKTAEFMVRNGIMPPPGYELRSEDCQTLGIKSCDGAIEF